MGRKIRSEMREAGSHIMLQRKRVVQDRKGQHSQEAGSKNTINQAGVNEVKA